MSTEVQPNFPVTDASQGSQPPETLGMVPVTSGREDAPAAPWQPETVAFDRHELREPMTTILPVDNAELTRMTEYLASGLPAIDEYHDFLDSNNHERFRVVQGRGLDVATGAELDAPLVERFNQVAAPGHYLLTEFQADDRRRLAGVDPLTTPMDEIIRYAHRDIEGFTQAAINIKAAEPNIQPEELDYRAALEVTEEMAREARHALELDAALRSWGYDDAYLATIPSALEAVQPEEVPLEDAPTEPLAIVYNSVFTNAEGEELTVTGGFTMERTQEIPVVSHTVHEAAPQAPAGQPVGVIPIDRAEGRAIGRQLRGLDGPLNPEAIPDAENVSREELRDIYSAFDTPDTVGPEDSDIIQKNQQPEQPAASEKARGLRARVGKLAMGAYVKLTTASAYVKFTEAASKVTEEVRHNKILNRTARIGSMVIIVAAAAAKARGIELSLGGAGRALAETAPTVPSGSGATGMIMNRPPAGSAGYLVPELPVKAPTPDIVMQAPQGGTADAPWKHFAAYGANTERQKAALFNEVAKLNSGKDWHSLKVGQHVTMPPQEVIDRILRDNQ